MFEYPFPRLYIRSKDRYKKCKFAAQILTKNLRTNNGKFHKLKWHWKDFHITVVTMSTGAFKQSIWTEYLKKYIPSQT